jgi:hypothetical protein
MPVFSLCLLLRKRPIPLPSPKGSQLPGVA